MGINDWTLDDIPANFAPLVEEADAIAEAIWLAFMRGEINALEISTGVTLKRLDSGVINDDDYIYIDIVNMSVLND